MLYTIICDLFEDSTERNLVTRGLVYGKFKLQKGQKSEYSVGQRLPFGKNWAVITEIRCEQCKL